MASQLSQQAFRRAVAPCFLRKGRNQPTVYAVALRDHPGLVKVGRTGNWERRRRAYDQWNLAPGDAISDFRTFLITEEYVDLARLELCIIERMQGEPAFGKEWFRAELGDVCDMIERTL